MALMERERYTNTVVGTHCRHINYEIEIYGWPIKKFSVICPNINCDGITDEERARLLIKKEI